MKKLLLIGANGFLGTTILAIYKKNKKLQEKYSIIAGDISKENITADVEFYTIDITMQERIQSKIAKINPDLIILTAAMTDVDQCERDKNLATKINFLGPKNVINACKSINSKLLFISTDFIFDGTKNGLYKEEHIPNPQSHYGKTKFHAELAILYSEIEHLICRTSVLYGWNPNKLNFVTWILDNLEKGNPLSIVTNQINSPTHVENLAKVLLKLIEENARGIYHTAGASSLSRYEMAVKCAEIFNYDINLITPIDSLKQHAQRPQNAGLDISKTRKLLPSEMKIFTFEEGLIYMKTKR